MFTPLGAATQRVHKGITSLAIILFLVMSWGASTQPADASGESRADPYVGARRDLANRGYTFRISRGSVDGGS